MVGERIGNYRIVQRLGEGGMATVYLASHPELGRRVAVKVLHAELARSDEMIQRFFNEARAASDVGHRGIVEVSDLGRLPSGAPYIVMELLEGESLADRMTRTGRLPLAVAANIAAQAASVMVAAHAKGIVHRDLKPDNLFLVPDPLLPGRELLKVLDFGIAKLAQRPPQGGDLRTRTGAILGTPRYMSPEQCRESRDVDHRADVYSLGVVLFEMLSGTPPFVSSSWGELAHMHIGVKPPALRALAPDVPDEVAEVVHRALQKDPGARFQSMAELMGALAAATGRPTLVLVSPAAGEERASPPAPAPSPAPAAVWRAGGTMLFAQDQPPSSHPLRRTTMTSAASEVLGRQARAPKRAVPLGPVLAVVAVVVVAVATIAVNRTLALRRPPEVQRARAAAATTAPAAPPPARPVELPPPPAQPDPPAQAAAPSPAPAIAAPSSPETAADPVVAPKAPPAPSPPRRKRAPPKSAAPAKADPRPQEPTKI